MVGGPTPPTAGQYHRLWRRLGQWIVRHPWPTLLVSGLFVLALSLPLLKASTGVSNERWFLPRATESRAGAEILSKLRSDNSSLTIYAIVHTDDGTPLLAAPQSCR